MKFAERARTEMMRDAGSSHSEMIENFDTAFAVSRCEVDYLMPAKLDAHFTVEPRVIKGEGAVVRHDPRLKRVGDLLARLNIRIACLNRKGRPQRLPEPVRVALTAHGISEELV